MSLGSGEGRFVRLWRCRLLSVPLGEQASGRRWDCSGLGQVARRCFGTKWYDEVPGARSTRYGDTGNEDDSSFARDTGNEEDSSFARFFKLDKNHHYAAPGTKIWRYGTQEKFRFFV
jgi:hypothetical protein